MLQQIAKAIYSIFLPHRKKYNPYLSTNIYFTAAATKVLLINMELG